LHILEADVEYLIRTLSEARSRASELAASIGARLGMEHRLAQLANSAASSIENMLREIRSSATEKLDTAGLQGVQRTETQPVTLAEGTPTGLRTQAPSAAQAGVEPEHWLSMFVDDLTSQLRVSGRITFEVAERLLQQRKDDFLKDFLIARRMYRTYPRLFPEIRGEIGPQRGQAAAQGGNN
jgi:hypothetical protein